MGYSRRAAASRMSDAADEMTLAGPKGQWRPWSECVINEFWH